MWEEGKIMCENAGMILAEISTREELDFLTSKYSANQFDGCTYFS